MGDRIAHCTARENLPGIRANGLLPPAHLARAAGVPESDILLRETRIRLETRAGPARLNHQKPILHGYAAAERTLDGHTPESWAAQLDTRVFFWPKFRGRQFATSVARDVQTITLWLDTRAFLDAFPSEVDLCPINSGNFRQGGAMARRGDWIYIPANLGVDRFRENRRQRGLVLGRDKVVEISLRCAVPADTLSALVVEVEDD
ncbi:MAG: hypothetical protein KDK28_06140 [Maritimibacter sp.]|nr:hypothetical protein [Maritimibacter sp.]